MNEPFRYLFASIALFFFTYVVLCAIYVPLTVDEAWTYGEFIRGDFWNVVTYTHPTANNHILNSLLAKPFALVSSSELSLRMPNVLAYALYLYASFKISTLLFENKFFQICLFIALQSNITMLQFFALCRGYGLSLGFMLFSLSQLIDYLKQPSKKLAVHLTLASAVLAMYASFTLLYFAASVFIAVFIISLHVYVKTDLKKFIQLGILLPTLYSSILLLLCYTPIIKGIAAGEFYWGGDKNFVDDTLFTLLQDMIGYSVIDKARDIPMTIFILLIVFAIVTPFIKIRSRKPIYIITPLILLWCMGCINIQFYFFAGKMLMHRTALFLFPLIIVSVFSGASLFLSKGYRYNIASTFSGLLTTCLLVIVITRLNLQPVEEWWFDTDNKVILNYISKKERHLNRQIRILPFVYCANSLNYYIEKDYPRMFAPIANVRAEEVENYLDYDYLYLQKYYRFKQEDSFKVINDHYCNDQMTLYKRK